MISFWTSFCEPKSILRGFLGPVRCSGGQLSLIVSCDMKSSEMVLSSLMLLYLLSGQV